MKTFLSKKSTGFYLMEVAALSALGGIISYSIAGNDSFGFVPLVVVFLALSVVAGVVFGIKNVLGLGPIVISALSCVAVGIFINDRFMYYSHLFYGIASEPITVEMVFTTVLFIIMIVSSVVSAFFVTDKEVK